MDIETPGFPTLPTGRQAHPRPIPIKRCQNENTPRGDIFILGA